MKIAYIIPGLDPTGPVFVVKSLVSVLVKLGVEIDIFYLNKRDIEITFDCPVYKISKQHKILFKNYDIIHSHCFSADRYVFIHRKELGKAKWVTSIHQDTIKSFEFSYPQIIAHILGRYWLNIQDKANCITAISNQIRDVHQQYVKTKIHTVYNGIDIDITKSTSPEQESIINSIKNIKSQNKDLFIVGTYANIVKRKGIEQVITCMQTNDKFCLVIIGDGEYKAELHNLVRNLKLESRVFFFPFIEAPYRCLDDIDVYVMPSYSEGFGLALLESAYVGKSIVCSDIPSFHELFTPSEVVFFELNNIESLSKGINEAFVNSQEHSQRAHDKAILFSKENMTKKYIDIYSSLINDTI